MTLTRVHPEVSERLDASTPEGKAVLADWYALPQPDWLRLNLIGSVDGSAQGGDGTSETLSNRDDRAILGVIRSLADVVLIGAQTLRAEGYLLPRRSQLAVLTGSGELAGLRGAGGEHADASASASVLVLGPARAEAAARRSLEGVEVEFLALPEHEGRVSPAAAVARLREHGAASVVCEGGPSVAAQLLSADLVDELCLSTSPTIAGSGLSVLGGDAAPARQLTLRQLLLDHTGASYARWSIRDAA